MTEPNLKKFTQAIEDWSSNLGDRTSALVNYVT